MCLQWMTFLTLFYLLWISDTPKVKPLPVKYTKCWCQVFL